MLSCDCDWIDTYIFSYLQLRQHVRPYLSERLVAHLTRLVAFYPDDFSQIERKGFIPRVRMGA
jgi:hypothetical protein